MIVREVDHATVILQQEKMKIFHWFSTVRFLYWRFPNSIKSWYQKISDFIFWINIFSNALHSPLIFPCTSPNMYYRFDCSYCFSRYAAWNPAQNTQSSRYREVHCSSLHGSEEQPPFRRSNTWPHFGLYSRHLRAVITAVQTISYIRRTCRDPEKN